MYIKLYFQINHTEVLVETEKTKLQLLQISCLQIL